MQAVVKHQKFPLEFSAFYQTYERFVRNLVRQFNFYDAAADDVVQDIFIKAWRGFAHLENSEALAGWLKVIARNHCISELQKVRRQKRHLVPVESLGEDFDETISGEIFEVTLLQLEEHLIVLRDLIQHHKDPIRGEIARLFYLENCSIRDICLAMDLKQNTVLSHLRRFRVIVTKAMQRWMETMA